MKWVSDLIKGRQIDLQSAHCLIAALAHYIASGASNTSVLCGCHYWTWPKMLFDRLCIHGVMSDKHPVALSGEVIWACRKSKPKTSTVAAVSLDKKTQTLVRLHVSPLLKLDVRHQQLQGLDMKIREIFSLYTFQHIKANIKMQP